MKRLVIRLLGEPSLSFGGEPLAQTVPARCMGLLAMLAMRRGDPPARASLAAAMWPDELDVDARANLRRHLHLLLNALPKLQGIDWIVATSRTMAWNDRSPAWIDVRAFEDALADPQRKLEAIELYRGDLLEGSYDECLFEERERLRGLYVNACFDAAATARRDLRFRDAISLADRIVAMDEWREDALRLSMTLRYEAGDRSSSLAQFERFAKRLASEMGVAPMPETLAVRDAILTNAPLVGSASRSGVEESAEKGGARTPFVGRQSELATLDSAWRHAASGRGTVLFLGGEAGVGKSRLVSEFASAVSAQGGRALVGETSNPQAYPYEPLVDALRRGLALILESPIAAPWLGALSEVLPELQAAFPEAGVPESLDSDKARRRLFEALSRTIERLARARPLLLVLEDLHWAQSATLEALEALARRIGAVPALIVATYRTDEVTPGHRLAAVRRRLQTERVAGTLELHAFRSGDVDEMVAKMNLAGDPKALSASVYARSEGNPLFAGLLLRDFAETGELAPERSAPPSIAAAISSRMAGLDEYARTLAATASVVGRSFTTDVLHSVLGWKESEILDGLGTLLDRGLIRASQSSAFSYAFNHALIEDAIYAGVPAAERVLRHRRIAEVLAHSGLDDREVLSSIARHWQLGGENARAGQAYLRSAQAAWAVYARGETIADSRAALSLLDDPHERFKALSLAIDAEQRSGDAA